MHVVRVNRVAPPDASDLACQDNIGDVLSPTGMRSSAEHAALRALNHAVQTLQADKPVPPPPQGAAKAPQGGLPGALAHRVVPLAAELTDVFRQLHMDGLLPRDVTSPDNLATFLRART